MSKKSFFGPEELKETRKNRFWLLITASPMLVALLVLFLFARPVTLLLVAYSFLGRVLAVSLL